MHKHLWPLKLFTLLVRNQLWLKPHAWRAKHRVRRLLSDAGYFPRSIDLSLGLAEAGELELIVVFHTDRILKELDLSPHKTSITTLFRDELTASGYPLGAVPLVYVSFHSHQEILRRGGYYSYFR